MSSEFHRVTSRRRAAHCTPCFGRRPAHHSSMIIWVSQCFLVCWALISRWCGGSYCGGFRAFHLFGEHQRPREDQPKEALLLDDSSWSVAFPRTSKCAWRGEAGGSNFRMSNNCAPHPGCCSGGQAPRPQSLTQTPFWQKGAASSMKRQAPEADFLKFCLPALAPTRPPEPCARISLQVLYGVLGANFQAG